MVNVGQLELSLLLDRTKFDRTLAEAERDAKLFAANKLTIAPQVDHRPLDALNRHLDKKQQHFQQLDRYLAANPITPRVNLAELKAVHNLMGSMNGPTVTIKTQEADYKRKAAKHDDCCDNLERAIKDNLSPVRDLLQEITDNTKKEGLIGKTVGTIAHGALFGTSQATASRLGEGIAQGLEKSLKVNFARSGQALGLGTGRYVKRTGKIADFASRELLGMPDGLQDLQKLARGNTQRIFDNLTDPQFYRELEDLFVAAAQQSDKPDEQKINQELFTRAREKIQSRFAAQIEEDLVRTLGALITLASHPLRIRKRIKLGDSARQAKAQEQLFRSEYEAAGIKEQIDQSESILLFTGGVAPNESRPGVPAVGTTHSMASALQTIFPNAFVDTVTPHNTVDVEQLQQGLYNQIMRENLLPFLKENKELVTGFIGQEGYNNVVNNLGQLHPIDAVLQQNIDRGYNPDSVRLATKALSASIAFPDKPVTLASGSGGGFIVEEAIAILNEIAKRYPELAEAVKRVKGFAIGTPIAGLTQTSRSGDPERDLAEFKAFIGTLDHVGKGFFGSSLYAGLDSESQEWQKLEGELGLPGNTIFPDSELQTVIKDWGFDHKVGEMLADMGKPISKFIVLLADFLQGNNRLTDGDARQIVEIFERGKNLKLSDSLAEYATAVEGIVNSIVEFNAKIGGQIDTKSLQELSARLKAVPELDSETAKQIPDILTGTLADGLGITQVRGLGARSQPGIKTLGAIIL